MAGLQKILKMYGTMNVQDVTWVWDYSQNKAVKKSEMTKEMFAASEKAKWQQVKAEIEKM